MTKRTGLSGVIISACLSAVQAMAATATLNVDVDHPGRPIPPNFSGLMTEEINHAYDGGLYAELVRNRSFQDDANVPAHWSAVGNGTIAMTREAPVNKALPVSLMLTLNGGRSGVSNAGFWGVPVKPATKYTASFYAKAANGFAGPITASLNTDFGPVNGASAVSDHVTGEWKKYTVTFTTAADVTPTSAARFVLSAEGTGTVTFSLVSLFPPTYRDAPNGLRPDLMKLMADLKPAFIRLPGGNYLEGDTFATRFDWKQQIGKIDTRPGHQGCWGYRSSDGMGLPEFMLWCDQLNAEPVLGVFAGYTLNGSHVPAGPGLQQYVDEALEEIEYFTGPADKGWGAVRAADGRKEPYKLRYVEIGNEDFFDRSGSYDGRFAQFYDAIKAKYPDLQVIATTPVKSRKPDLVDDHYYLPPKRMAKTGLAYRDRPADEPNVFLGEWASQQGRPTPTLLSALGDAAFLVNLESDAHRVPMQCYAPLLVNVNPGASQWGTNLIGYDAMSSFGSPSYHAQVMLAQHVGDVSLPAELKVTESPAPDKKAVPHGAIGVGSWHTANEYKDIKVTHDGKSLLPTDPSQSTTGWQTTGGEWTSENGVFKPRSADAETWAIVGDPKWADYTITMKARKTGGAEGFLVMWHAKDGGTYRWWNVGGWGNTRTTAENADGGAREPYGPSSDTSVENDKWYDLKIEVRGDSAKCYIDDKLVTDATAPAADASAGLYASANYASKAGEVIVKVVNMSDEPLDTTINLRGATHVGTAGKAVVLTGDPADVNTIATPTKVAPKTEPLTDAGPSFKRTFPPHSLTILTTPATVK